MICSFHFALHLIDVFAKRISLTSNQRYPDCVFLTVREQRILLKHGINRSVLPRKSSVSLFWTWLMTSCKIVGGKEVSSLMNSGKFFHQLSSVFMQVMSRERNQWSDL